MKAFPSSEPIYRDDIVGIKENSGMDLRDYFAAKAMQELLRWDLNMPHSQQCGVYREHITREEVTKITEHIDARFNRLEEKIDRLFEAKMLNA